MARLHPTCDRAELPEPRHSDAKQLDVYNTSQPLPSSLTKVYSDLHLLGRGVPTGRHGQTTNCTMPPSSLTTMPQLTPTPMPTPVTHSNPESAFFPHPNGCTRRTMTLPNRLFENPGQQLLAKEAHKIGSLPKRTTTNVVGGSTNNCLIDLVVKHKD